MMRIRERDTCDNNSISDIDKRTKSDNLTILAWDTHIWIPDRNEIPPFRPLRLQDVDFSLIAKERAGERALEVIVSPLARFHLELRKLLQSGFPSLPLLRFCEPVTQRRAFLTEPRPAVLCDDLAIKLVRPLGLCLDDSTIVVAELPNLKYFHAVRDDAIHMISDGSGTSCIHRARLFDSMDFSERRYSGFTAKENVLLPK